MTFSCKYICWNIPLYQIIKASVIVYVVLVTELLYIKKGLNWTQNISVVWPFSGVVQLVSLDKDYKKSLPFYSCLLQHMVLVFKNIKNHTTQQHVIKEDTMVVPHILRLKCWCHILFWLFELQTKHQTTKTNGIILLMRVLKSVIRNVHQSFCYHICVCLF